jgi:hypothetical protein
VTLALVAPAYLDIIRAQVQEKGGGVTEAVILHVVPAMLPLPVPEVRRPLGRLVGNRRAPAEEILAWSGWCRRHQARAPQCHGRRMLS